jgi:hypothetical protein
MRRRSSQQFLDKRLIEAVMRNLCNRPWRPTGLSGVEAPNSSWSMGSQMAVRLSLRADRPLLPEKFLVLISVGG